MPKGGGGRPGQAALHFRPGQEERCQGRSDQVGASPIGQERIDATRAEVLEKLVANFGSAATTLRQRGHPEAAANWDAMRDILLAEGLDGLDTILAKVRDDVVSVGRAVRGTTTGSGPEPQGSISEAACITHRTCERRSWWRSPKGRLPLAIPVLSVIDRLYVDELTQPPRQADKHGGDHGPVPRRI